jgi:hypothetical protein
VAWTVLGTGSKVPHMQLVQINQKPTMPTISDMIRQMAQKEVEEIRRAREKALGNRNK